eukprot:CAMPEP_0113499690 /NCGR_PEP_ID=MMETSP0014_2-20120614/31888_1 /TAXON_ID=2857 /ORGANISM="Nitzschia sp." /LENGTH=1521 /DNA_ID=CAMNT_0000393893 /DNA_START=413 /DNA_END=4974 /DNA_ORIENTATION=+ /assembly_acc=CAM_ASM_000159
MAGILPTAVSRFSKTIVNVLLLLLLQQIVVDFEGGGTTTTRGIIQVVDAAGGTVEDGFIDEIVTTVKAMSGGFAPNPRNGGKPMMILNAKNGQVSVVENPDDSDESMQVLDINDFICTNGERGLHTVIAHPNFMENNWVYAFYTQFKDGCLEDASKGPSNVVMRFTMDPTTLMIDYESRKEIWNSGPMYKRLHNGGAMVFGNESPPLLYITTGDAGERDWAQELSSVYGKIIRLNDDGTVPDWNPFSLSSGYSNSYRCADHGGRAPADGGVCGEIFAVGLRNPFRIALNPNVKDKTVFTIGDVGAQHMESLYYGGSDYKAANYGWPMYEGVCYPGDFNSCRYDTNLVEPFHWYQHVSTDSTGGAVAGQAFVPEGVWPAEFNYLFIDFIFLKIFNLETDRPERADPTSNPPYPPTRNATFYRSIHEDNENVNEARMTSLFFGPYKDTQALYVTKFGNLETILRIRYNGILNKPPNPDFTFSTAASDPTGFSIQYDASATTDPENDALAYLWDFGDGNITTGLRPIHRYNLPGEYSVLLTVTDSQGQAQQVYETVKVGIPPRVNILFPMEGDRFNVDQVLRLSGEALDHLNNPIPDENFVWEVRQHHADHYHPFMDLTTGNDIDTWPAPIPEDYFAATNSFLRVLLTVTDSLGVTTTETRDVQPNILIVNLETKPQGLNITVDGYTLTAPYQITSWYNYDLPLNVVQNQSPYVFKGWSDGETDPDRTFKLFTNMTSPTVTAIFCVDMWMECTSNDDCCSGACSPLNVCVDAPTTPPTIPTPVPTAAPSKTFLRPPDSGLIDPSIEDNVETPADVDDDNLPDFPPDDKPIQFSDAENDGKTSSSDERMGTVGLIAIGLSIVVVISIVGCLVFRRYYKKQTEKHVSGVMSSLYGNDTSIDPAINHDLVDLEKNCSGRETDSSDGNSSHEHARLTGVDSSTDVSNDESGSANSDSCSGVERAADQRHVVGIPSGDERETFDSDRVGRTPLLQDSAVAAAEHLSVMNDEDTATLQSTVGPSGDNDFINLTHMSSDSACNTSAFKDEPEDGPVKLDATLMVDMTPDKVRQNVENNDLETSIAPSMIGDKPTMKAHDIEASIGPSTSNGNAGENTFLDLLDIPNDPSHDYLETSVAMPGVNTTNVDEKMSFMFDYGNTEESRAGDKTVDEFDVNSSQVVSNDIVDSVVSNPLAIGCPKVEEQDLESDCLIADEEISSSQSCDHTADTGEEKELGGNTDDGITQGNESSPPVTDTVFVEDGPEHNVEDDVAATKEQEASLSHDSGDLDESMAMSEPRSAEEDDAIDAADNTNVLTEFTVSAPEVSPIDTEEDVEEERKEDGETLAAEAADSLSSNISNEDKNEEAKEEAEESLPTATPDAPSLLVDENESTEETEEDGESLPSTTPDALSFVVDKNEHQAETEEGEETMQPLSLDDTEILLHNENEEEKKEDDDQKKTDCTPAATSLLVDEEKEGCAKEEEDVTSEGGEQEVVDTAIDQQNEEGVAKGDGETLWSESEEEESVSNELDAS